MSDDLDLLAQSLKPDDRPDKLKGALNRGLTFDPDAYAKAVKVSAQTGVVPTAILRDQQAFDRRMPVDPGEFVNLNPKTAAWLLGHEDNAAQAHDDLGTLARFERATKDVGSQILQIPQKAMGGLFRGIGGIFSLEGAVMNEALKPDGATWAKVLSFGMNPLGYQVNADVATEVGQAVRDYYKPLFTDPALTPSTTSGEVAGFVGDIAGTLGKATLSGPAAPLVFGAEAFGESGGTALERGAGPGQAVIKAGGSGTLNTALAFIPGGKFGSQANLAKAFEQGGRLAVAKEVGKGIGARVVRGTALGTGVTVTENLLSRVYDPKTPLFEGLEGNIASFIGLEGAGYLAHAVKLSAESKLKARNAEAFKNATSEILKGSGAEEVMISAERFQTFFQETGVDPAKMAEHLGVKNYAEALAAGTDLILPTSDTLAKLPTEHLQGLLPDLKLKSDSMTAREARAYEFEAAKVDLKPSAEPVEPGARQLIYEDTRAQLLEAGNSERVADILADRHSRVMENLARDFGEDPLAMNERFGLRIYRPAEGGSPVDISLGRMGKDVKPGETAPTADFFTENPEMDPLFWQPMKRGDAYQRVRARQASLRSLSPSHQSAELTRRAEVAKAEEQAFLNWEADIKATQAGDIFEGKRGFIQFTPDRKVSIALLEKADLSTFTHEVGHMYLEVMGDLATAEGAKGPGVESYRTILGFLGVSERSEITKEHHEKFARAMEAYAMEGKAPTPELQTAFQRVKFWMMQVYKNLRDLGVNLNNDIRGVFDRMFAGDEAINRAQKLVDVEPLFARAEDMGIPQAEFDAYAKSGAKAIQTARETVEARLVRELRRERETWWKEESAKIAEKVAAEIDKDPVQQAFQALSEGVLPDGTPIKLNKGSLEAQFGKGVGKDLPRAFQRLYTLEGGVDAEAAAEVLGFNSGSQMMDALKALQPRRERIQAETEARMKATHGDLLADGSIGDAAIEAMHNESREQMLYAELKVLRQKQRESGPIREALAREKRTEQKAVRQEAKAAVEAVPKIQEFRTAAKELVGETPIRDLDPWRYLQASRKASREAFEAMSKDRFSAAADAKQKELLNHHLYLEATKAKAEAAEVFTYGKEGEGKDFQGMLGKAGKEYQDQWNALATRYEFRKVTNKALDERTQSLAEWARLNEPDGALIDPMLLVEGQPKNWREVSVNELRAVHDALVNIETVARHQLGATLLGVRLDYEREIADFELRAREVNASKPAPRKGSKLTFGEDSASKLQGFNSYMQKLEWFIDQLDGGDINGPARKNIKKPIDDAAGQEKAMHSEVKDRLLKALGTMTREERAREYDSVGVTFPKMDRPMNRMQLFSWALNLGTEENRKVAILGEGLLNEDLTLRPEYAMALSRLTKAECERIQGIWDALESMRPAIVDKERRVTGLEPKWKSLTPLTVDTVDGHTVHLRGGYYPLKADHEVSNIGKRQMNPTIQEGTFSRPTTSRSHTETVTGATYPLLLDYPSVLSQHIPAVIKDVTTGEAIAYVSKFIMNDKVAGTIRETLGPAKEKEFLPWLQSFAGQGVDEAASGPVVRFLMSRRSGMVVARLGGNLTSYLVQTGDFLKPITEVKPGLMAQAFADIRRNPAEVIEEIRRLSPNEMRFREKNFNRDIRDMLQSKPLLDATKQRTAEFLMSGFEAMDRLTSFPAWLAKYREGMATHGKEAQAVMEADRLIARTMQAGEPRNMSRIMREPGLVKLFTTFGGDANTWYGLLSSAVESKNVQRISTVLMAAIAEQALSQILRGKGPDKDKAGEWALEQAVGAVLNPLSIFGDLAEYGIKKAQGKYAKFNSPTMDAIEKLFTVPAGVKAVSDGRQDVEGLAIDAFDAAGLWLGIPLTGQIVKSWKYQHGLRTGKQPTPANKAAEVKNTLLGPPPKEK